MKLDRLAEMLFEAWKDAKRRRGVTVHITNHNGIQQNLLEVPWSEVNAEDKAFDLEILRAVRDKIIAQQK